MKCTRLLYALFLVGTLLALTTATALAWPETPPDKVTISGPGLKGEVEVTDQEILAALSLGAIEDFKQGSIAEPKVGQGYQITRYFYDASFDFGRLRYYPNATSEPGYIFFEDGPDLDGDQSQYHSKWFYATPQGDRAMKSVLTGLGISPSAPLAAGKDAPALEQAAANEAVPSGTLDEASWWPAIGVIMIGVCALALTGGLIISRR